ncbi:MAG TPA: lysophospholipid acyltransferase family protein [Kofleriaceae bacterium]|nr:lysophospholipid acyltransferase family protein [Kofleriaceae bacterium]
MYRILAWLLRAVTRVFFRQIEVVGLENIPATGGVVFAGNHPNSMIDPILIIATCGRKVHFAAKDVLFKGRLMRGLLRGLGAVPIHRRHDHDGDAARSAAAPAGGPGEATGAVDNEAAFAAMFAVLAEGAAIGIFPEGLSHDSSQLARLKTGAARLALGGAHRAGAPLAIVPCGLTFIHPKRFRSRVLVQYGPPIAIALPPEPPAPDAVRALTAELDAALRRLTINAPDWDTVRALDTVRRLYQPAGISIAERVELARRFNTHYAAVAGDPRVVALMARVGAYRVALDELGITDRELTRELSSGEVAARMMRHIALVAFWLPVMVPGAPLHVPAVVFARIAGPRLTPRKDVIATTKLLVGMLLVLLSYAAAVAVLWWRVGLVAALIATLVLPLSGVATLRVLDRARLVRRAFGVLLRRLRFRREVVALRETREQLVGDVIRVVGEVKPVELPALFPADDPRREAPPP